MLKALFVTASLATLALAMPARAQDIKQEVEKIATAYTEAVAKHDAAGVAALYAKDGIQVNVVGQVKTDLKATYEEYFKNGEEKIEGKVNHVSSISNDVVLAAGDVDVYFNVEPIKRPVFWSAVYVREGGQLKIRMLTVGIKPPPPKEASADTK